MLYYLVGSVSTGNERSPGLCLRYLSPFTSHLVHELVPNQRGICPEISESIAFTQFYKIFGTEFSQKKKGKSRLVMIKRE